MRMSSAWRPRRSPALVLTVVALGCAPRGPVVVEAAQSLLGTGDPDSHGPATGNASHGARRGVASVCPEAIDLWLHGFDAQGDSTLVPYFRPGYRETMNQTRRARGITTALDANRDRLASYLAANPRLVAAQFIPLYFETWDAMRQGFDLFIRANGNSRYGRDAYASRVIATFAASFPSAADRQWAETFVQALDDERVRFYRDYWIAETRAREGARTVFEQQWQDRYRPRLRPFFVNAQQDDGDVLLALPLGGEGRTVSVGRRENYIAVPFPDDESHAAEPIFVLLHELAGPPANLAVHDHTTPAEQRDGTSDRYASLGAVRGGAIILQRIAPDVVGAYQRYYLTVARVRVPEGDPGPAFERTFALSPAVADAIGRQIDIILGGI
ncbi:MAG: hypothetical protein U0163_12105 [Gemmatimonadaceae bacterium]